MPVNLLGRTSPENDPISTGVGSEASSTKADAQNPEPKKPENQESESSGDENAQSQ